MKPSKIWTGPTQPYNVTNPHDIEGLKTINGKIGKEASSVTLEGSQSAPNDCWWKAISAIDDVEAGDWLLKSEPLDPMLVRKAGIPAAQDVSNP